MDNIIYPTPCDFLFWSYVKRLIYDPSLPTSKVELKQRITDE